jgi:hypothetical protein
LSPRGHALAAVVAAFVASACGGPAPPAAAPEPQLAENVSLEPQEPADPLEVRNSGRTLSGVYEGQGSPARLTLMPDGTYSRTWPAFDGTRADAGTYVLDDAGTIHFFVEQAGDARLSWARRVSFSISGDPASSITLVATDGRSVTLARTGDPPALAAPASPAG